MTSSCSTMHSLVIQYPNTMASGTVYCLIGSILGCPHPRTMTALSSTLVHTGTGIWSFNTPQGTSKLTPTAEVPNISISGLEQCLPRGSYCTKKINNHYLFLYTVRRQCLRGRTVPNIFDFLVRAYYSRTKKKILYGASTVAGLTKK
jgi:hypothetical protein